MKIWGVDDNMGVWVGVDHLIRYYGASCVYSQSLSDNHQMAGPHKNCIHRTPIRKEIKPCIFHDEITNE